MFPGRVATRPSEPEMGPLAAVLTSELNRFHVSLELYNTQLVLIGAVYNSTDTTDKCIRVIASLKGLSLQIEKA
jgi:hypothetical protein